VDLNDHFNNIFFATLWEREQVQRMKQIAAAVAAAASVRAMTAEEAADKWGADKSSVTRWCKGGLIPGAGKDQQGNWRIPGDAKRPRVQRSHRPKSPSQTAPLRCFNCGIRKQGKPLAKCPKCKRQMTREQTP
jgi:hypothetical protein